MLLQTALLVVGVFACSTAVIWIKASEEHALLVAAYRLFLAAMVLVPFFLRDLKKRGEGYTATEFKFAVLPGIVLGLHFISWIYGARLTTAANATLIVNFMPVAMPFFLFFLISERINFREVVGTILALAGMILLTAGDVHVSKEYFWGDILCFVSMLFFAGYLALGRKNRHVGSIWIYVVPLYAVAGVFCFIVALFFVNPIKSYALRELGLIGGLAIVPTVIGHSILNQSMKKLRGQVVSIVNMGQFIFAGIMAFVFFREVPKAIFYIACGLVVSGAWLAVSGRQKTEDG